MATQEQKDEQCPELRLAQTLFMLATPDVVGDKAALLAALQADIFEHARLPLYLHACSLLGVQADAAKVEEMRAKNAQTLKELEDRVTDAETNLGESEVREALLAKANFFVKIGDKAAAEAALAATEKKTVAIGHKMDLVFTEMQLHLTFSAWAALKRDIKKLKDLLDQPGGSDWERRNKLKVYEGICCMAQRDFPGASALFLDSLSTFTATEVCTYTQLVFYTVVCSAVSLDRVKLKQRCVDAPEVRQTLPQLPDVGNFLDGLYTCRYGDWAASLPQVAERVGSDRYMHPHLRHFLRQARGVAYAQFLESYKSVRIDAMAAAFGVSPAFLDSELCTFIARGTLSAKIDQVAGIVETDRPDTTSALYQELVKHGDLLLNRLQKLNRLA